MDEKLKNICPLVCLQSYNILTVRMSTTCKNSCDKHLEICTYLGMNFIEPSFQKVPETSTLNRFKFGWYIVS